jgi:hypothetical protein
MSIWTARLSAALPRRCPPERNEGSCFWKQGCIGITGLLGQVNKVEVARLPRQRATANRSVHAARRFAPLASQIVHKYQHVKGGDAQKVGRNDLRQSRM